MALKQKEKVIIYKIYFPATNKVYIGQTCNPGKRFNGHLRSKTIVGKALRKYDDWEISCLHICNSRKEANQREIDEIEKHNCIVPNGYNLETGGKASKVHEITKLKIKGIWKNQEFREKAIHAMKQADNDPELLCHRSKMMSGQGNPMYGIKLSLEQRDKLKKIQKIVQNRPEVHEKHSKSVSGQKHPMYGRHHTEKSKRKIAAAREGQKLSEEHKIKIGSGLRNYYSEQLNKTKFLYKQAKTKSNNLLSAIKNMWGDKYEDILNEYRALLLELNGHKFDLFIENKIQINQITI